MFNRDPTQTMHSIHYACTRIVQKLVYSNTLSPDASVTSKYSSTVPQVPPCLTLTSYVLSLCGSLDMSTLGPK